MERETGFEPATLALARRCSTTELFPLSTRTKPILLAGPSPVKEATGPIPVLQQAENLRHAIAAHVIWYNFGWVHQTLRGTPAMGAAVHDHFWTVEEIHAMLEN